MDKYYLSSNIYYYFDNKTLYYENDKEDIFEINDTNWADYLEEYDITDLYEIWRERLRDNKIGIKDCGANGDCLFNVIAEALNVHQIYNTSDFIHYDAKYIREIAANAITDDNYDLIIDSYKAECNSSFFMDEWDPTSITSKEALQDVVKTVGNLFWGDHLILELLQNELQFNVIIFKDDESKIYPTANYLDKYDKTILIYYIDDIHFQLITYFNKNKLITVFTKDNPIPDIILKIYNEDTNS
tara:strand:+ start:1235 stop:1963 length:729 start_codon:yes stop_codon:yes gene_type:complete